MTKFKAGDKVRCVDPGDHYELMIGKTYTVSHYVCRGLVNIKENRSNYYDSRFELVEPANNDLQALVDKANEGLKAQAKLVSKYATDVEVIFNCSPSSKIYDLLHITNRNVYDASPEIRVKPKKTFEPFTTSNGWDVRIEGDKLHIGCQSFPQKEFRRILSQILNEEMFSVGGFHASRKGIAHDQYTLPWADAEKIYEKLKELE